MRYKWSDSGYILKVELMEFANGLDLVPLGLTKNVFPQGQSTINQ